MKLLKNILFTLLMGLALTALATDQGLKVDLLIAKITASLKADKAVDALPYFAELESMESSLSKPLPESFHFYYIDTLNKSGNNEKALSRADIYLSKFGKKGKYYDKVIEIISPIQIQKDKEAVVREAKAKEEAIEKERILTQRRARYEKELAQYNEDIATYDERVRLSQIRYAELESDCNRYHARCRSMGGFFGDDVKANNCVHALYSDGEVCDRVEHFRLVDKPKAPIKQE